MRRYLALLPLLLLFAPAAQASPASDLYRQVKRELAGEGRSCWLMTPAYQSLFVEAAQWFGAEPSCAGGVQVMAELRRKNSATHYKQQGRRQLKAIRRAETVSRRGPLATLEVSYRGTPPGWTFRPRSRTRETYQLEQVEGEWNTDSVEVVVRPPLARPTR